MRWQSFIRLSFAEQCSYAQVKVLEAIASAVVDVGVRHAWAVAVLWQCCLRSGHLPPQDTLRTAATTETGTFNPLGDKQLVADVAADEKVVTSLRACGAVALGSSEEQPADLDLGGRHAGRLVEVWGSGGNVTIWPGHCA